MEATNTTVVKSTTFLVLMATVVQIMEINALSVKECSKILKSSQLEKFKRMKSIQYGVTKETIQ